MSIGDGEWKLWREGDPFPQRFTATISEDGDTIAGRWEKAEDGANYTTDFYLTYTQGEIARAGPGHGHPRTSLDDWSVRQARRRRVNK